MKGGERVQSPEPLVSAEHLVRKAHENRLLFDVPGYEQAVPLLKEAVELASSYAPAYAELALTYAYWGFRREISGQECESLYDMAHRCAETALDLNPKLAAAHLAMAVALRRGQGADALRRAQEAAQAAALAPEDAECLCETWRVNGYDPDDPILKRVLELSPGFVAAHIDRGAVLSELERYPEALEELEKALRLNPENAQVYYDLAMVLDRMGYRPKARTLIFKALGFRPEDPLLLQGRILLEES